MDFERVARVVGGIPYTSREKGRFFYDFVLKNNLRNCLELGFAHGVSTCYIAAAADELDGHVTSVDLEGSRDCKPAIEELLEQTGLTSRVTVVREPTSYTWFLKNEIERYSHAGVCRTPYDFCFIDGPKNWTNDGCAFFLADKVLREDGWIMFDDYSWTYESYEAAVGSERAAWTRGMARSTERCEPHIKAVFHDLGMQHPNYGDFRIVDEELACAKKVRGDVRTIRFETRTQFRARLMQLYRALRDKALARPSSGVLALLHDPRRNDSANEVEVGLDNY